MAQTKEIQSRIKSVKNTKKVTKAMEMVAAAKMRRATESVLKTRKYAQVSWDSILRIADKIDYSHNMLEQGDGAEKIAIVLFTSNRGLCGGFNSHAIKKAHASVLKHEKNPELVDFILVGARGAVVKKHYGYNVIAEFNKPDTASGVADVLPIAKMIVSEYLKGKYKKILIAYTDFVNPTLQIPHVRQILPLDINGYDDRLGDVRHVSNMDKDLKNPIHKDSNPKEVDYVIEPNPQKVLDVLISRLIDVQLFQALLESNASEHSARMSAMHQATDAAGDMIKDLTLTYNKARQAGITQEIAEIGAGVNAMNS